MEAGKNIALKFQHLNKFWFRPTSEWIGAIRRVYLEIPAYGKLQSYITDKNNNPIENAIVYLTSITNNTTTDGSGNYTFENLLPREI